MYVYDKELSVKKFNQKIKEVKLNNKIFIIKARKKPRITILNHSFLT